MNHEDAACRYARGLRIFFRGLPLDEREKILDDLLIGMVEEEVLEPYRRQPRKFQVVNAFLQIVNETRKSGTTIFEDVQRASCEELQAELADLKEVISASRAK